MESLLTKTLKITNSRNAKTLSTSHMKQCIMSEQRFDFLRELVKNIPDISVAEEAANYNEEDNHSSPEEPYADSDTPYDLSMPSTSSTRGTVSRHQQQQLPPYQYHNLQQQPTTNGQNGGGNSGYDIPRNYLKRSMSSHTNSVIMHTTAIGGFNNQTSECLPAKLLRSESTPVPPQHHTQLSSALHPRLKHQPFSMPSNSVSSNNSNSNNNNSSIKPNIPPKQTAIPAPIVSIDYCNKPVVKIDYSNLPQLTTDKAATGSAAPLSAPAHISSMSGNKSAFNFSAEPVINIDLSNIVTPNASATTPPVATISIGAPLSTTHATQQSRNSKASMAEPFNSSSVVSSMTTATSKNNSSCLELDEDYDNI